MTKFFKLSGKDGRVLLVNLEDISAVALAYDPDVDAHALRIIMKASNAAFLQEESDGFNPKEDFACLQAALEAPSL